MTSPARDPQVRVGLIGCGQISQAVHLPILLRQLLRDLCDRWIQQGFRFHQSRARRVQQRLRLEPLSFYRNLLLFPFTRAKRLNALALSALLGVSQAANAAGYTAARLKGNS